MATKLTPFATPEGSDLDQVEGGESSPLILRDNSRSKYSLVGSSPSFNGTARCEPSFSVAIDMSGWR